MKEVKSELGRDLEIKVFRQRGQPGQSLRLEEWNAPEERERDLGSGMCI